MRDRIATVVMGALAACSFEADYGGTRFRCQTPADCPDRTSCVDGLCQIADDGGAGDGAAAPVDGAPCDPGGACPADHVEQDGGCYRLVTTPTSWEAAEATCAADCGHLIVIGETVIDVDEHFVLHEIAAGEADVWIGVTDRARENEFRWVTGPALDLGGNDCFWDGDEPDDDGDQDCVVQRGTNECGDWTTQPCGAAHAFVCERDGSLADPGAF